MIKFHCLALLAASVASSPIEILSYKDAEAGHGQVMSGTPGEAVMGEFHWKAPEGDAIRVVYTADMDGYVATGEHLPVSPELTPEVMEARAAFMDKFDEAKARAVDMAIEEEIMEKIIEDEIVEEIAEAEVAEVIEEALGLRNFEPDVDPQTMDAIRGKEKRDADAQTLKIFPTQPLHYAPSYPYYFVNNLSPTIKKVVENDRKTVDYTEMTDDSSKYYLPRYAPAFYYPQPVVQYPTATTVTQRVSPWYPVSNVQYPLAYPGLVSQVGLQQFVQPQSPEVSQERILPSETQEGEEESAALLL